MRDFSPATMRSRGLGVDDGDVSVVERSALLLREDFAFGTGLLAYGIEKKVF